MTWTYAYTSAIWLPLATILFLVVLASYTWRRRDVPGALPFAIACLSSVLWVTGYLMQYLAVDVAVKVFWFKFQVVWELPTVTALFCFALEYAWPGRWLSRRNLLLLAVMPLLFVALLLVEDPHHLIWSDIRFNGVIEARGALLAWLFVGYSYAVSVFEFAVFIWLFVRSPQHRWPVALMITGLLLVRVVFLLNLLQIIRWSQVVDVLVLPVTFLIFTLSLFGFRVFDPIPMARRAAIDQLDAGMVVLDKDERVVSLNPAAEQILSLSTHAATGRPIRDLIDASPESSDSPGTELRLGKGREVRVYSQTVSILKDWRGSGVGWLLLLTDVTQQRRDQSQIIEQQRVLGMLQERERLARELHDSLGQLLAAAHMQANAAETLLEQGALDQVGECLETLMDITTAAEADIREYLLGAKAFYTGGPPFFPALRQYVRSYNRQYGLQVELSIPSDLEERGLDPEVAVQLLRIIQEALSNVRKHASAKRARVTFGVSDAVLRVAIADDGQGFDPAHASDRPAHGFGLRSMRERAEVLDGSLDVISRPGTGTRVVVHVPVDEPAEMHAHNFQPSWGERDMSIWNDGVNEGVKDG